MSTHHFCDMYSSTCYDYCPKINYITALLPLLYYETHLALHHQHALLFPQLIKTVRNKGIATNVKLLDNLTFQDAQDYIYSFLRLP